MCVPSATHVHIDKVLVTSVFLKLVCISWSKTFQLQSVCIEWCFLKTHNNNNFHSSPNENSKIKFMMPHVPYKNVVYKGH